MTHQTATTLTSALSALALSAAAYGQFTFAGGVSHVVGANPAATASGDFNGDLIPDLAVTVDPPGPDVLAIFLGNGDGTFAAPFNVILPASSAPEAVVAGDLDGDLDVDLAVGLKDNDQVIAVINGGLANFTLGATAPTGAEPRGMDIADLTGDGRPDLAVANRLGDSVTVLINNGNATFTSTTIASGPEPRDAAFGDFDGDGDQDIYWTNRSGSGGDRILRNDGNDGANKATFTTLDILPLSVVSYISRKATVTDFDADGRLDLVVMKEVTPGNSRPTILRNTTVGGVMSFIDWTPAIPFPADQTHKGWHAAAFDADGDGRTDVFIGGWVGDHLMLQSAPTHLDESDVGGVLNVFNDNPVAVSGHAPLAGSDTYTINGLTPGAFVSVVLTGSDDYLLEVLSAADSVLASVDRGGLGVEEAIQYDPATMPSTIKLRVTVQECAGTFDLDGDCQTSTSDLLLLLAAWGPNPGHAADFDGDGEVGTSDLLEILANWGPSSYALEVLARDG